MQINIVELLAMGNMDINTIKNIEIITLKEEIVQILRLKFYLREGNLEKTLPGTMILKELLELG